jgi:hypothetical protein
MFFKHGEKYGMKFVLTLHILAVSPGLRNDSSS